MSAPNPHLVAATYCETCGAVVDGSSEPSAHDDARKLLFVLWDCTRESPRDAYILLARTVGVMSLDDIAQRVGMTKAAVGLRCKHLAAMMPTMARALSHATEWQKEERRRPAALRGIDALMTARGLTGEGTDNGQAD